MTPEHLLLAGLGTIAVIATNIVCYRSLRREVTPDEQARKLAAEVAAIRADVAVWPSFADTVDTIKWRGHVSDRLLKVEKVLNPAVRGVR